MIYKQQDDKLRLREGYWVQVNIPANDAWSWDSIRVQFEFFADDNSRYDIAFITIKVDASTPLPYPTIMPDKNNWIAGGQLTNFFGIVFRSNDGDNDDDTEGHEIVFEGRSVEVGGILVHQENTVAGDSSGMLYCHAGNPNKLVPACIITEGIGGRDFNHIYGFNQTGALRKLGIYPRHPQRS